MTEKSQTDLSLDERIQLLASPDSERLQYFLSQILATKQVWTLENEEGFVMVATDDADCIMVWPDAEFAGQWAVEEWGDCEPVAISLDEFSMTWLPSLIADEIDVAVFPNIEDEGTMLKAKELAKKLEL